MTTVTSISASQQHSDRTVGNLLLSGVLFVALMALVGGLLWLSHSTTHPTSLDLGVDAQQQARGDRILSLCAIPADRVVAVAQDQPDWRGVSVLSVSYEVVGGGSTAYMAVQPGHADLVTTCG